MLARVALTDDFSRGGTNKRISLIILRSGTSKRGASPHFFDYFFVARRHKKSERVRIFTEFFCGPGTKKAVLTARTLFFVVVYFLWSNTFFYFLQIIVGFNVILTDLAGTTFSVYYSHDTSDRNVGGAARHLILPGRFFS